MARTIYVTIADRSSQVNGSAYPTLFAMAMDYLPIQASSVPCERIFSSSSETDTKRRNRISPLLMEALQMLKFYVKAEHLNFMEAWMVEEKMLSVEDPDSDLLGELLKSKPADSNLDSKEPFGHHEDVKDTILKQMALDED